MSNLIKTIDYKDFIKNIKSQIQTSQIKAAISVNSELLHLYWFLGSNIVEKQKMHSWGTSFIKQISKDLQEEFPNMSGFSEPNLRFVKRWYLFYSEYLINRLQLVSEFKNEKSQQVVNQLENSTQLIKTKGNKKGKQVVSLLENELATKLKSHKIFQIPWGHHILLLTKIKDVDIALYYVNKTVEFNWSRSVLEHQIESKLYEREGKAVNNFSKTLPEPQSDLANQILKSPYNFDFLTMTKKYKERELEKGLTDHITQFLLELGSGFSFVGKQYPLTVGGDDFFIDLLFYHVKLHCFVVIELKTVKFKPEYAGKLNFYVSAMDGEIKTKEDKPTIGILICKSKNNSVVEYSLNKVDSPIGVSEYDINDALPDEFKSNLPSIEEFEAKLDEIEVDKL